MNQLTHGPQVVHYLPIATTVLSAVFCVVLMRRYRLRGKVTHLLWWSIGVFFYGVGTGLESAVTLLGNTPALNKAWYIRGAAWRVSIGNGHGLSSAASPDGQCPYGDDPTDHPSLVRSCALIANEP